MDPLGLESTTPDVSNKLCPIKMKGLKGYTSTIKAREINSSPVVKSFS